MKRTRGIWGIWGALGLVGMAACGDDGTSSSNTAAGTDSGSATTTATASATYTTSETTPTTSIETGSGDTGSATGDETTGVDATVGPTSDSGSSTSGCVCTPGEQQGCQDGQVLECAEDCSGFEPTDCPPNELCLNDACVPAICMPGETQCANSQEYEVCNQDGTDFDPPVACADTEQCVGGDCITLCALAEENASSVGCSFFANRMDNLDDPYPDVLVVGNISDTKTATVQLYNSPGGVEQAEGAAVQILPGEVHLFDLTNTELNEVSELRVGGSYRVESDIPVVAYQHSSMAAAAHNDASMLLPEHAQRQNYVIASYEPSLAVYHPSYFNVIALQDDTTVSWTPPVNTKAGVGVAAVLANQTGMVTMDRYDTLQVSVENYLDLTGTLVEADKPIWVVGAVECVNVPAGIVYCDHIEEQMLPFDYWGDEYVAAHAPQRGSEDFHWRVFAGDDGVMIDTTPQQIGFPLSLDKGEWIEFSTTEHFIFTADGPILPVQYLEGQNGGAGTGDPSMHQMVPSEQFLTRYAFATGTGYTQNYAQIIREQGNDDVLVDGVVVNGYVQVGNYEVADWPVTEGPHLATSNDPFGIIQVGYTGVTSYAYPGGMRLQVINPQ